MDDKVQSLIQHFDTNPIEYGKFASIYEKMIEVKTAYPNVEVYQNVPGQHNTEKWLQAISEIYRKEKSGLPRMGAIRSVVGNWHVTETFDFLNWVKFYESGDHMKYKFAQLWYENDSLGPGYFLQVKKDNVEAPAAPAPVVDVDAARTEAAMDAEKREKIEKQRNKIIGRLDSAEKLLRTPDGQIFSGKEFESLLETIYQLKKKIQMVNKISSSTRLYEDMIIREANVLIKRGFDKAADVLFSVAQTPAQSGEQAQGTPNGSTNPPPAAPPADPTGAGQPGPPSGGAATPAQPPGNPTMPQSEPNQPPQPKGISDFLERMDDGQYSPEDDLSVQDDELEVSDQEEELLVSEAQVSPEEISDSPKPAPLAPSKVEAPKAPTPAPGKPSGPKAAPAAEPDLEVTEDDIKAPTKSQVPPASNIDAKLQQAFAGVTVQDVISKLEELSKIYKTREIPRQLNLVDMMLHELGMATFFPSLSEASNKALESNNYISSRVEDILSKLRGSGGGDSNIDLTGEDIPERADTAGIKSKLQDDENKEKARKQQRKDQEAAELNDASKETPEVEIEEDLGAPPAAPAAPPKA